MADRTLVQYDEKPNERGYWARLRIERSSAGQPGGLITVEQHAGPDDREYTEATVALDDLRRLYPATDWASDFSAHQRQIKQLGQPRIGSSIMREADQAILMLREMTEHVDKNEPVTLGGKQYVPVERVEHLEHLLHRIQEMARVSVYVHGDALETYIRESLDDRP